MKIAMPFSEKRIRLIGTYLAEFALDFIPGSTDTSSWDANDFLALFDREYSHFLRYVETNRLVTRNELLILSENLNELDDLIKEAAIYAAREVAAE
jgi:hypothetical protein